MEGADEQDRTWYLVVEEMAQVFGSTVRPIRLMTAVTALGGVFLWPLKLPTDGRSQTESWARSGLEIAARAQKSWVHVSSDMELRQYVAKIAAGDFGEPKWPTEKSDGDLRRNPGAGVPGGDRDQLPRLPGRPEMDGPLRLEQQKRILDMSPGARGDAGF